MKVVHFTESNHTYTAGKENYISVSGLWKPYFKHFDAQAVSIKKAFKELDLQNYDACKRALSYEHPDLIGMLQDNTELDLDVIMDQAKEYRDTWTAKAQTGTDFHAKEEQQDLEKGFRMNPFTGKKSPVVKWDIDEGYENQSFPGNMYKDLPDGYIPEWLVKDDSSKTAGQGDQGFIETIGKTRYIDLDDWKTDETILLKPTFFNRKTGYQKMLYPFDHMYETNHWKYACKISTYAKMLEMEGFVVRNLAFTHVVIDKNLEILKETRYKLPYKSFEAKLALQLRRENL